MADDKKTPAEEVKEEAQVEEEVQEEEQTEKLEEESVEPQEEEKETETPPEEEVPVEETEQEFDLEEFKQNVMSETQQNILSKISEALGMDEKDGKQAKEEGMIPPWEKENRNPKSYKEIAEYSADLAIWKKEQVDKEVAESQKEQEREAKEENKKWNDYWDNELKELEEDGKIPPIKDENDPNDPGKQARIKLFGKMKEIGDKRQAQGEQPVTSIKLVYYEHYEDPEPPGADAPVSFGKKGVSQQSGGDDYSYWDIHNKSIDQIKDGK